MAAIKEEKSEEETQVDVAPPPVETRKRTRSKSSPVKKASDKEEVKEINGTKKEEVVEKKEVVFLDHSIQPIISAKSEKTKDRNSRQKSKEAST